MSKGLFDYISIVSHIPLLKRNASRWRQVRGRLASYTPLVRLYSLCKRWEVTESSPYENIYYCCTQKTGSQWLKAVFSDPLVFRYTGLKVKPFTQMVFPLQEARFDLPLPKRSIGAHLYIDYPTYLTIPKPTRYRTFFILRDPRDITVSWYFSAKWSHSPMGPISKYRSHLRELNLSEGLKYSIDKLEEMGLFSAQRSWMRIVEDEENIKIFRYESLAGDNRSFLRQLFDYLDIRMPQKEFGEVCRRHEFQSYSAGRKQGVENSTSPYRKGIAGDWKTRFDHTTIAHFRLVTEDLLEVLGYE